MRRTVVLAVLFLCIHHLSGALVRLNNIRFYTYPDYTRVVLDLSDERRIREKILPGEERTRLYFDLSGCDFAAGYPEDKKKEIPILKAGNLKRIRLGHRARSTLRVVFDFNRIGKYEKFYLTSPFRIVFDIFRQQSQRETDGTSASARPAERVGDDYSLQRQLGLGVRKIIIDPGHGGKDPGTFNKREGLYEKILTLDIARRLRAIIEKDGRYEVILTRNDDRYISLEERTAIANSHRGDIFISIHINSAPRTSVRGIESYYLSLTTDPWAVAVAAQENAMTTKSIWEMKSIVERIIKTTRKSESKILTEMVHEDLVKGLSRSYDRVGNLGVKRAPFFVLVGASMPATLVEVSFLSNSLEASRLKSASYRSAVASGIYHGIMAYIASLGK